MNIYLTFAFNFLAGRKYFSCLWLHKFIDIIFQFLKPEDTIKAAKSNCVILPSPESMGNCLPFLKTAL